MALSLSTVLTREKNKKGYKPKIGIDIDGLGEAFSSFQEFASDTERFTDEMASKPTVINSVDQIGGVAKRGGMNFSIHNQDLFSDKFVTGGSDPDPENEDVDGFLYFDVADVAKFSVLFDSTLSQYIEVGQKDEFDVAFPISVEIWVMFNDAAIGNTVNMFASNDQADSSGVWVRKEANDSISISYGDDLGGGAGNRRSRQGNTTTIVADRWYCIHALFKGTGAAFFTNAKIYINGTEEAAYTDTGTTANAVAYPPSEQNIPLRIGRKQAFYFDGYISQVGFWDAELSAADFLSLYGEGTPKDLTAAASYDSDNSGDLQGNWKMTEGIGTTVDEAENNADGTLTNSPLWSHLIPCCLDADRLQFFKGEISDFPDISYNKVPFTVDHKDALAEDLATNLIDGTEESSNIGIFNNSAIGMVKPIIYGANTFRTGHTSGNNSKINGLDNSRLTKLIFLGKDDVVSWYAYFQVCDHEVDFMGNKDPDGNESMGIWCWDSELNRHVLLDGLFNVIKNDNTDGFVIRIHKDDLITASFYDFYFPDGTASGEANTGTPDWVNETNAADNDLSTFASQTMAEDAVLDVGDKASFDIDFSGYQNDGTITQVAIMAKTEFSGDVTDYDLSINGVSSVSDIPEVITQKGTDAASEAGVNTAVPMVHEVIDARPLNGATTAKVYSIFKRVKYTNSTLEDTLLNGNLYIGIRGMMYDTWINGRTGGETHADDDTETDSAAIVTSTSTANGGSGKINDNTKDFGALGVVAGDILEVEEPGSVFREYEIVKVATTELDTVPTMASTVSIDLTVGIAYTIRHPNTITNFAGVIESILRDRLSLVTADVDENDFNISSNDLSTAIASFDITDEIVGLDLCDDICKKIRSILFPNNLNEFTLRTFVGGDPFSVSGDSVANNEDIFEFDPQTTFKIVTGENDKIRVQANNFTLTAAEYTGASLASEIETKIQVTYTIDCDYSATTGKFTFTNNDVAADLDIEWLTEAANNTVGRFIGFDVSVDDTIDMGGGTLVSDYPLWADSFVEHPIVQNSFTLPKASESIFTTFNVKYALNIANGNYQIVSTVTDTTYHAETITKDFEHPYTYDATTAEFYRDHLKDRQNRKHYVAVFSTFLNAINLEQYDTINVRHPVLSGLISSEDTKKWKVLSIKSTFRNLQMKIRAVEV